MAHWKLRLLDVVLAYFDDSYLDQSFEAYIDLQSYKFTAPK